MTYFTVLHWITLSVFFLIFILLIVLAKEETDKKIFWSMVFSSFLVISLLSVFSLFVLDKYTKKAKLVRIVSKRVLLNETIMFFGSVKNVGKFKIGKCKLRVKIVNNALNINNLSGSSFYAPKSGLESLFTNKKEKPSTIIKYFTVAKNLLPGRIYDFSATMPYPPYFQNANIRYKLYCQISSLDLFALKSSLKLGVSIPYLQGYLISGAAIII